MVTNQKDQEELIDFAVDRLEEGHLGLSRPIGRPPGKQNTVTLQVKDMLVHALSHAGGWKYFYSLIKSKDGNDRRAVLALVGKLIPTQTQVSGPNGGPIETQTSVMIYMPSNGRTIENGDA